MAVLKLPPSETHKVQPTKRRRKQHHHPQNPKPKKHNPSSPSSSSSSWDQIKNLLKCKQINVHVTGSGQKIHQDPVRNNPNNNHNGYSKLSSCSSICSFKDVANGNITTTATTAAKVVVHRADYNSPESSTGGQHSGLLRRKKKQQLSKSSSSSSSSVATGSLTGSGRSNGPRGYTSSSSSRGMQLRKLSGCYECHAIVDPARSGNPRSTICLCSECGEVFPKVESLEHHQAVKHAVSELGLEDSGRNIVEIIFKSSWQNKDHPIFTIERVLKINNTRRIIQRFEEYRDTVKTRATATASRCAADGNELLRFHCTILGCPLGSHGSSSLCGSVGCGVCTVIRYGFQSPKSGDGGSRIGVCTTASSGRAHDSLARGVSGASGVRAMLVCRVIAGKVKRVEDNALPEESGVYDSVAGYTGSYSNIEELYVYNPRAILPCFVVIYKAMES